MTSGEFNMETTTKTMIAMVMSVTSTVRKPATKSTPKWARTTDGVVGWWGRNREWLTDFKSLRLTERLLRLFAVGCCRSPNFWANAENDVQKALKILECFADGEQRFIRFNVNRSEMESQLSSSRSTRSGEYTRRLITLAATDFAVGSRSVLASSGCSMVGYFAAIMTPAHPNARGDDVIDSQQVRQTEDYLAEHIKQGRLLAGIAAPDWCLANEWRTSTAVALARGIYEERAFDRMPILADALQEEGCDNGAWLARMRDPEWPWCTGCHVLDSLLPELCLKQEGVGK